MKSLMPALASAIFAASCNTADNIPGASEAEQRAHEASAVENVGCVFENQARCAHIIEHRTQLALYFTPDGVGRLDPGAKSKGRRVTTNFVIEAASTIQQCTRIDDPVLRLLPDLEISGGKYQVVGTTPLSESSRCYLTSGAS